MPADRTRRPPAETGQNHRASDPVRDKAAPRADRRELIVVKPKETARKPQPSRYADALFLAHVFASKFDAPQTRQKRRADPAEANTSYRKSAKRPVKPGRVLSKKI